MMEDQVEVFGELVLGKVRLSETEFVELFNMTRGHDRSHNRFPKEIEDVVVAEGEEVLVVGGHDDLPAGHQDAVVWMTGADNLSSHVTVDDKHLAIETTEKL